MACFWCWSGVIRCNKSDWWAFLFCCLCVSSSRVDSPLPCPNHLYVNSPLNWLLNWLLNQSIMMGCGAVEATGMVFVVKLLFFFFFCDTSLPFSSCWGNAHIHTEVLKKWYTHTYIWYIQRLEAFLSLMGCGATEATGLGIVCFVVINPCVLSANSVDFFFFFLFHKFSNFVK